MKENAVVTELFYFAFYKPTGVLSQMVTDQRKKKTLRQVVELPEGVQAIGRLDEDSEGLLLLTNDAAFNHYTLQVAGFEKEYWVQVAGTVQEQHLKTWSEGVSIQVEGKTHLTKPCVVKRLELPLPIPARVPHLLKHQQKPFSWVSFTLVEGKNRQVRRMTAALGFPALRLVRVRITNLLLGNMQPGELRRIEKPW